MATTKYGDLTIQVSENSAPVTFDDQGTITLGGSSLGQEDVALLRIMTDRMKDLILEGQLDTTVRTRLRALLDRHDDATMRLLADNIHDLMNEPIIRDKIMGEV